MNDIYLKNLLVGLKLFKWFFKMKAKKFNKKI